MIGEFGRTIAAFSVEIVEQTRGAALVGVLADIARILGFLEVAGGGKIHDLACRTQVFVCVDDVGAYALGSHGLIFLRLGNSELRSGNFTLVAVENRERDAEEGRRAV